MITRRVSEGEAGSIVSFTYASGYHLDFAKNRIAPFKSTAIKNKLEPKSSLFPPTAPFKQTQKVLSINDLR